MAQRPIVGIICQTLDAIPGQYPPCWIMGQRYVKALQAEGAVPWLIPLLPEDTDTLRAIFERLDGLFLTGGVDVDPSFYGEEKSDLCGRTDLPRDQVEIQFIRWCLAEHKPILAVCRGLQAINVATGGTLYQDVHKQANPRLKHDWFPTVSNPSRSYLAHEIKIEPGTRLRDILGTDTTPVNSMHHQAIKTVSPALRVSAIAPDGVIEAIEGTNGTWCVGVQWHPEELTESVPCMKRLFTEFLSVAAHSGG